MKLYRRGTQRKFPEFVRFGRHPDAFWVKKRMIRVRVNVVSATSPAEPRVHPPSLKVRKTDLGTHVPFARKLTEGKHALREAPKGNKGQKSREP